VIHCWLINIYKACRVWQSPYLSSTVSKNKEIWSLFSNSLESHWRAREGRAICVFINTSYFRCVRYQAWKGRMEESLPGLQLVLGGSKKSLHNLNH
jgi:hypothetical protein